MEKWIFYFITFLSSIVIIFISSLLYYLFYRIASFFYHRLQRMKFNKKRKEILRVLSQPNEENMLEELAQIDLQYVMQYMRKNMYKRLYKIKGYDPTHTREEVLPAIQSVVIPLKKDLFRMQQFKKQTTYTKVDVAFLKTWLYVYEK